MGFGRGRVLSPITGQREPGPYDNSFGDEADISILKKDGDCCWYLQDKALTTWITVLCPLLKDIVEGNKAEIHKGLNIHDTSLGWVAYMIGRNKQSAKPTVVIVCEGRKFKKVLKKTIQLIVRHPEFRQHEFNIEGVNADLQFLASLPQQGQQPREVVELELGKALMESEGPISLCSRQLSIPGKASPTKASIGGTIILDGQYYALTVAHPLAHKDAYSSSSSHRSTQPQIFTKEWAMQDDDDDSDGSDDDDATDSSDDTKTDQSSGASSSDARDKAETTMETEKETSFSQGRISLPVCYKSDYSDDGYSTDWALLQLEDPRFFCANEVSYLNSDGLRIWAYMDSFSNSPPEGAVSIFDGEKLISASGNPCTSVVRFGNTSENLQLWSLHSGLERGMCGCWVFNDETHKVYGPLVGGSKLLHESFLVPFSVVFEDIREKLSAVDIRFPSLEDTLWLAVCFNDQETVVRLLKAKVSANAPLKVPNPKLKPNDSKLQKVSMLHLAAREGNRDVVTRLLERDAETDVCTSEDETPLHWALYGTKLDGSKQNEGEQQLIVESLVINDANPGIRDKSGWTPLDWAHHNGYLSAEETIRKALERHPNVKDQHSQTPQPLHHVFHERERSEVEQEDSRTRRGGKNHDGEGKVLPIQPRKPEGHATGSSERKKNLKLKKKRGELEARNQAEAQQAISRESGHQQATSREPGHS